MALEKDIVHEQTGAVVRYWRVTGFAVNVINSSAQILLGGYLSKALRDDGKRPVFEIPIKVAGGDFADVFSRLGPAVSAECYEFAKRLPRFEGALDV